MERDERGRFKSKAAPKPPGIDEQLLERAREAKKREERCSEDHKRRRALHAQEVTAGLTWFVERAKAAEIRPDVKLAWLNRGWSLDHRWSVDALCRPWFLPSGTVKPYRIDPGRADPQRGTMLELIARRAVELGIDA